MPIRTYNPVQTGPKTQAGGFRAGFASAAYQVGIDGAVKIEPITPAKTEIPTAIINLRKLGTSLPSAFIISALHLVLYLFCPGSAFISSPKQPGNIAVGRSFFVMKILSLLIHLVAGKVRNHSFNGAGREMLSVLQIPRAGDAHRSASPLELVAEHKPFYRLLGYRERRPEINTLISIFFGTHFKNDILNRPLKRLSGRQYSQ